MKLQHGLATTLFCLHALLIVGQSIPNAPTPAEWKLKSTERILERWHGTLGPMGLTQHPDDVRQLVQPFTDAVLAVQQPTKRFLNDTINPVLGTHQRWAMFSNIRRTGTLFELQVKRGRGPYETLYFARSDDFVWRRDLLEQERVRTVLWSYGKNRQPRARALTKYLGELAKEEDPRVTAVRGVFHRETLRSPEEVRNGVPPKRKIEQQVRVDL